MTTDWQAIRELMAAVIDYGEAVERAGYQESDRARIVEVGEQGVSLQDFMISSYTLPEQLRRRIICARHDAQDDAPYIPDAARALTAMAAACAELIGTRDGQALRQPIAEAAQWYRDHAIPHVRQALTKQP